MRRIPPNPDRRSFIHAIAAATAVILAHQEAVLSRSPSGSDHGHKEGPKILSLELLTGASLASMKAFYCDLLGLPIIEDKGDRLTIRAGESKLTFVSVSAVDPKPFYHFAFNIPENKIRSALTWQKQRSPLMPIPARLRDKDYPDEVVNYSHWNAHSIFFFDPGGNVVEYIARHDLPNGANGDFSSKDILCASEIGLIVDDVPATAKKIGETTGWQPYKAPSELFTAMGDEVGLLLVMKRGRILDFHPTSKGKAASIFKTRAAVRGIGPSTLSFGPYPYEVIVES